MKGKETFIFIDAEKNTWEDLDVGNDEVCVDVNEILNCETLDAYTVKIGGHKVFAMAPPRETQTGGCPTLVTYDDRDASDGCGAYDVYSMCNGSYMIIGRSRLGKPRPLTEKEVTDIHERIYTEGGRITVIADRGQCR